MNIMVLHVKNRKVKGDGYHGSWLRRVMSCQVLGRRREDGRSVISVSEMRDGIVTFESEGDAQRFSAMLEAGDHHEVSGSGSALTRTVTCGRTSQHFSKMEHITCNPLFCSLITSLA